MNKHLKFLNDHIESGRLPETPASGLCGVAKMGLISKALLYVFQPTDDDENELDEERLSVGWWASGVHTDNYDEKTYGFTPLRQTIVAFMAVIKLSDFYKK